MSSCLLKTCIALDAADVAVSTVHCERRQKKGTNSIGDQVVHTCRDVDRVDKDVFVRVPTQVQDGGGIAREPTIGDCVGEVVRFVCHDLTDELVDIDEVDECIAQRRQNSRWQSAL